MKCSKIQEKLLDYVYGEMKPAEAVKVEQHIAGCAGCAAALKDLEFTRKVFRSAEGRVPSNQTVEKLCDAAAGALRLREQPRERERRIIRIFSAEVMRPFLAGAACALILAGITLWIFKPAWPPPAEEHGLRVTTLPGADPAKERELIQITSTKNDPAARQQEVEDLLKGMGRREMALRSSLRFMLAAAVEARDPRAIANLYTAANLLHENDCASEALLLYTALDFNENIEKDYRLSQRIAEIYEEYGVWNRAIEYYEKAISRNPDLEGSLRPRIEKLRQEMRRHDA